MYTALQHRWTASVLLLLSMLVVSGAVVGLY